MRAFAPLTGLLVIGAFSCALGVAGCGDEPPARAGAAEPSGLPFPPQATEPATSSGGGPKPAGTVVAVGGRPEGIVVDPASGTAGVALRNAAHDFALLDAATLAPRTTARLPGNSRHASLGADGTFLVPIESTNQLAQVSPESGRVELTAVGKGPHAATSADGQLFVADELGGTVTALRAGKTRATFPVDVQPGGIVDVGQGKVAVVSVRAYSVELFDTTSLKGGGSQNAGYGPSHAVADDAGRIYISDTRGGNILQFQTRPRLKFLSRLHLGGSPYGLAIDPQRQTLWTTDSGRDRLYAISTAAAPKVVKTYPTVRQPNTVAVDIRSGAAIVASETNGQLQRVVPAVK